MTRRQRLLATLAGEPVDRPAVSFYEINGLDEDPYDPDPFNIYSHPSWTPLIQLARERTDRIVMRSVPFVDGPFNPVLEFTEVEACVRDGSLYTTSKIQVGSKTLLKRTRRDPDLNTTWVLEPLLKNRDDLELWLTLPEPDSLGRPDPTPVLRAEEELGDTGIAMIDTPDPLCLAAELFRFADFTVVALKEPALFHKLLERFARVLLPRTEAVARALPRRLWRIYGPEYASPPYLPPRLFREYVVRYDTPMVEAIHRYGGYTRIHSHGRLDAILDDIASTGCDAIDPIEPPPQGDVELSYVRDRYGEQLVLFGNLEVNEIEFMDTASFEKRVARAVEEGTSGSGRGFVLMPSACPYGPILSRRALANYEKMIEVVKRG